jgi:hypothetical protein
MQAEPSRTPPTSRPELDEAAPWWRFAMVWLVIGGPVAVVLAGIATTAVAFRGADPAVPEVLPHATPRQGGASIATAPALQARNHAAIAPR